jgi:uncharacterized repeat protein (TIGR01451 family)
MKKLWFALLLIWVIPLTSAITINLSKNSYQPGETLQAQITGNFVSLNSENILVYKEGIPRPNPTISDLTSYQKIYYFYSTLPDQEGNFSLVIEGAEYMESGKIKTTEIIKNFTIKKTNQSALGVYPGFVIAKKDFSIKLIALSSDMEVTLSLGSTNQTKTISLIQGSEETIKFSIEGLTSGKTILKILDYDIPIFVIREVNQSNNYTIISEELDFIPYKLLEVVYPGDTYNYSVKVENTGTVNLTGIKLSSNLSGANVTIKPNSTDLNAGESILINVKIQVNTNESNRLKGEIIAKTENDSYILPISFSITSNKSEVNITNTTNITIKTNSSCADMGGKLCNSTQTECTGVMKSSRDGNCCIGGECIKQASGSYTKLIIGIILVIIVIIIIGYSVFKSKSNSFMKSPRDLLKQKDADFKERMQKPSEEPNREVRGSLDTV